MGRGIILPFVDIYPYITARFPTSHPAPQFDARTAKTRRTDIQRYPNPKSEALSSLSQARKRPQNRPPPAFARPTAPLVRNGEAVSAYDASSTPQTSDISHTPNRARPPPLNPSIEILRMRHSTSFFALASTGTAIIASAPAYQTILLSLARNMCFLSDCPQLNRFKPQETTQNTPSPDARAHATATAAPATRLNSSTHREHPASSHSNTAF